MIVEIDPGHGVVDEFFIDYMDGWNAGYKFDKKAGTHTETSVEAPRCPAAGAENPTRTPRCECVNTGMLRTPCLIRVAPAGSMLANHVFRQGWQGTL